MIMLKRAVSSVVSRFLMAILLLGGVFFFGASYAYSGMKHSDQTMIRIAYANGYKDAMEYAFKAGEKEMNGLKTDRDQFKTHVLYAADAYVDKVSKLN